MKKFLTALLLLVSAACFADIVTVPIPGAPGLSVTVGTGVNALPLQNIQNNPNSVNITQGDDSWTNVPLGFDFPFFGRTFNNSWAMTNGMVTFQDPVQSGIYGACCSGVNLAQTTDTRWNYSIYALHTDLYSWNPNSQYYLRENNAMTYGWYNLSQCCSNAGGNSFEIKITSSGTVDTRIAGAMVQWNAVTSGMSGDLSKGEYYQYYHGSGINIPTSNPFSWNTAGGFTGTDPCLTNPLSSPTCAGYAAAYMTQQCTISALYNQACPGYATAYYSQQCTANPLYDVNCPGYASAYLNYQCSVNPLYATTCSGYEQAYFNQQCTANPLYNTQCPGYAQAYALRYVVVTTPTTTTTATSNSTTTATTTPTTDSSGAIAVAVVADPVVNQVVTTTATSASPAQSATATVPLVQTTTTSPAAVATTTAPAKEEKKDATSTSVSSTTTTQTASTETKADAKPTVRQELQAKREAAAKAKAIEDGKNLANNMGKAADMETQKVVQNVVIAAMGYTPGFDTYGKVMMPDTVGYKPFTVYNNQKNVDNKRLGRGLYGPSDRLHNELVDSQYKGN